ncbi:MAG TPA: hypothetical protein VFQ53_39950 [Kofleriaceae bacterium]|nr:hypothetical protein [Kofleriaceae bacterium]
MGDAACDLLEAELALDRLEATLAAELPAHLRAFAEAHARGAPDPIAPPIARHARSLGTARGAFIHPLLEARAIALLRVLAPLAIDDDPRVHAARQQPRSWSAWQALAAARDAAARDRFGLGWLELVHRLHGSTTVAAAPFAWPAPLPAWTAPERTFDAAAIEAMWTTLAARHRVGGACRIVASDARARTFVVEPGAEVIVVVPRAVDSPAQRFAVLHELGHAIAALAVPTTLPRAVDEAVAAYVARALEQPAHGWHSPIARAARTRRLALARALDAIERGDPARPTAQPPWALWHDAGAQAAYVAAEAIADRWSHELGDAPSPGALAAAIARTHAEVDRALPVRF